MLNHKKLIDALIAAIRSCINKIDDSSKSFVRGGCKTRIGENLRGHKQVAVNDEFNIVKNLRGRNCYYLKADNETLDKTVHFQGVRTHS